MKILRKPVKAIIECPLCNCEFTIEGKDWRRIEKSDRAFGVYLAHCPNCYHPKKIIPGEVKCRK
jgi:hypothetical protein